MPRQIDPGIESLGGKLWLNSYGDVWSTITVMSVNSSACVVNKPHLAGSRHSFPRDKYMIVHIKAQHAGTNDRPVLQRSCMNRWPSNWQQWQLLLWKEPVYNLGPSLSPQWVS